MDKSNLIFLDTETTGIGAEDRLCQVAYKFKEKEANAFFKPEIPISVEAMAISHVTNKMVANKEKFVDSEMKTELNNIILDREKQLGDALMLMKRDYNFEIAHIMETFKFDIIITCSYI
jgi:DNA polymerase III alpha subunit (gram-positive type)